MVSNMRKRHRYQGGGLLGEDLLRDLLDKPQKFRLNKDVVADTVARDLGNDVSPRQSLTRFLLNRDTLGRPGASTTEEGLKDMLRFGRKALSPLGGIANLIAKSTVGPTQSHEVRGRLVQRQSGGKIPVRGDEANGDVFSRPLETVPKPFSLTRLLLNRDTLSPLSPEDQARSRERYRDIGGRIKTALGRGVDAVREGIGSLTRWGTEIDPYDVRSREREIARRQASQAALLDSMGLSPTGRDAFEERIGMDRPLPPRPRRPGELMAGLNRADAKWLREYMRKHGKYPEPSYDDPFEGRRIDPKFRGQPGSIGSFGPPMIYGPPEIDRAAGGKIPGYQFGGQWGGSKGMQPGGAGASAGLTLMQQQAQPNRPQSLQLGGGGGQWGGGMQQPMGAPPGGFGKQPLMGGPAAPGGGGWGGGMQQPSGMMMAQPGGGSSLLPGGIGGQGPTFGTGPDFGPPGSPGGGGQPPAGQPPTGQPPAGQPPQPTPYQPQPLPRHYGTPTSYQGFGMPTDFASTQSFVSPEVAGDWAAIKSGIMQSGGRAYNPYAGPHLAGFTPDEAAAQAAYAAYGRGAGPASTTAAARTLRGAGRGLESLAPEQARMASTFGAYAPFAQEQAQATAEEMKATGQQAGTPEMQRAAGALDPYVSQYTEGVLDPQIQAIRDEAARQRAEVASQTAMGGTGGYRRAIEEGMIGQQTTQQIADVTGKAYADAQREARAAFEADRAAQQAGLQQRQQAQQAAGALQQQGFGTAADLWRGQQGALGAEAGLYGQMTQTGAAQTELGRQEQAQQLERLLRMQQSGMQQRKLTQAGYDIQKGLHKEAQQWAPEQLEWMTRMMGALPYQNIQHQAMYTGRPGGAQQAGLTAMGIWDALGGGQPDTRPDLPDVRLPAGMGSQGTPLAIDTTPLPVPEWRDPLAEQQAREHVAQGGRTPYTGAP